MARFGALPREGHFGAVVRMFAHLKKHLRSRLVYDTKPVDLSDIPFTKCNWGSSIRTLKKQSPRICRSHLASR